MDSQIKHFPALLRLLKINIAHQKRHTMLSFYPIYTWLCYRKRGLNDKLKHKTLWMLYHSGCNISWQEVQGNIGNKVWQMGPNTSSLFHPTLPSRNQPFLNSLLFIEKIPFQGAESVNNTSCCVESWIISCKKC